MNSVETRSHCSLRIERGEKGMMSQIPVKLEKIEKKNLDKEILRAGIMAELDAVNLYEQMAAMVQKEEIRTILLEIAREEKTHISEFQALLLKADTEQAVELRKGEQEVREKTSP
jgi:rubrerythrin